MNAFSFRPLPAMVWELWRASRWELLMRLILVVGSLLFLFSMSRGFDEFQMHVIRALVLSLTMLTCVFSSSWMSDLNPGNSGFKFRLGFARPISSFQLVLVPMAYSVLIAMLCYIGSCCLTRMLLDFEMPFVGPTIIVGASVCLVSCVTWSSTHPIEKLLGLFGACLALIAAIGFVSRFRSNGEPVLMELAKPSFLELAWYMYPVLGLACFVALQITVLAVGKQRYGEGFSWTALPLRCFQSILQHRWLVAVCDWLQNRTRPGLFHGRILAQLWLDARRSVGVLILATVCTTMVLGFVVIVPLVNPSWGGAHSPRIWFGAIVFSPLLYQLLATEPTVGLRQKEEIVYLSLFDSTRPLRCDQLIAVKLLVIAGWSIIGCSFMVLAALLHATLAGQWTEWAQLQEALFAGVQKLVMLENTSLEKPSLKNTSLGNALGLNSAIANASAGSTWFWWLAALVSLAFSYFASAAVLTVAVFWLPKNRTILSIGSMFLLVHMGIWAWDASHGMKLLLLWRSYGYLLPIAVLLLSLHQLKSAYAAGYLGGKYFAGVLGIWLAYVACNLFVLSKAIVAMPEFSIHPMLLLNAIAILLMPVTFAAKAPLALADFRHG